LTVLFQAPAEIATSNSPSSAVVNPPVWRASNSPRAWLR
jgi:hypothetical protein